MSDDMKSMKGRVLTRPEEGVDGVTFTLAPTGGGAVVTVRALGDPPPIGALVWVDGRPYHRIEVLDRGVEQVLQDWIDGYFTEPDRELYEVVHALIRKQDGRGATIPETEEWLGRLEDVVCEARAWFFLAALGARVPEEAP